MLCLLSIFQWNFMVTFCQQLGLGEGGHCATRISNIYFVYTTWFKDFFWSQQIILWWFSGFSWVFSERSSALDKLMQQLLVYELRYSWCSYIHGNCGVPLTWVWIKAGIGVVTCFQPLVFFAEDSASLCILLQKEWTDGSHVTLSGGTWSTSVTMGQRNTMMKQWMWLP